MKAAFFVLGFLTGTLGTYAVLTRLWWPDVRLDASRAHPESAAQPTPIPGPASPPSSFATPEAIAPVPIIAETPEVPPVTTPAVESTPVAITPPGAAGEPSPPAASKTVELPILQTDLDKLKMRALLLPVQGAERKSLRDTFDEGRGGVRRHQATDIMAAKSTPVLAADDGRIEKLFTSKPGGLTIYQFDPLGEYCYYYAHLDGYAPGIEAGRKVRKGEVIGYVGSTGNAASTAPHLHFAIFRLGVDKRWWEGTAVNAFPLWGTAATR